MPQTYLDFDLEIGPGDGLTYPLAVLHSPAGNARGQMDFPFRELDLENRLLALQNALLRSGGARRKVLTDEERSVRGFGQALFAALFRDDVRSAYDVSRRMAREEGCGLRLKLRILAPDLAVLPWEYLFDERLDEYVCLSFGTPIVRFLEVAQPILPLAVTPPLRILAMIASPAGLTPLDVAAERQKLERAVAGLAARHLVQLQWLEGQTRRELHRAMRPGSGPWHIFHFVGHGGFDPVREEGFLALCDREGRPDLITATELGRELADHPTLRLVVLNACESAHAAKRDIFSSAAATLVRRGVPAAVAMQYEITDRAAIEFAELFYEALAEGLPVDAAVTDARKGVSGAIRDTLEWGIPVLIMRSSDGVLFEVGEAGERVDKEPVDKGPRGAAVESQPLPSQPPRAEVVAPDRAAAKRGSIDFNWVSIPAGEFVMGSDKAMDKLAYDDETPQHTLYLPEYRIARIPVTVAQFAAFMAANPGYRTTAEQQGTASNWTGSEWKEIKGADWAHPRGPGSDVRAKQDHPVTCVSWHDALAFCKWAGVRLPTEAEWEKAARGPDGGIWPWGDRAPNSGVCNFNMTVGDTTPVGSYPDGKSPYGLLDVAGNVWEWTSSLFRPYKYDAGEGREDPKTDGGRTLRGGSFGNVAQLVRCACRGWGLPLSRGGSLGFRVVSPGF